MQFFQPPVTSSFFGSNAPLRMSLKNVLHLAFANEFAIIITDLICKFRGVGNFY
jgi:hypothetical protein